MIEDQNVPIFEKRVLFGYYKGHLGVIFQTPPNMSSKKAYLGVKFGGKITQNSCLGDVFSAEGKSPLGYVLKTSGHACVQHYYRSAPPPGKMLQDHI